MLLEALRADVCRLHLELPKNNLVAWTTGNVSGCDRESNLVVVKPSGVRYEELTPEGMVVMDLEGRVVEGTARASSDAISHIHIYQHRSDVAGVVHTHSTFATAFAAVGRSIPPCLTAICDEFGGEIPCGDYAKIGGLEIGEEVLRSIGSSKAILLKNHGVFTIGRTPLAAVKSAVMVEDVARTMYYAYQLGEPDVIPPDEVARAHRRYLEEYGQP
jgi:L-ribulose-5-phosphate 4-epimerase